MVSRVMLLLPELRQAMAAADSGQVERICSEFEPIDIALALDKLADAERLQLFRFLPIDLAVEIFENLEEREQAGLLDILNEKKATVILNEMAPDERADLFEILPDELEEKLLARMSAKEARDVRELTAYDPDSAGGLMTTEFVRVTEEMTADEVIALIRRRGDEFENVFYIYIVDANDMLKGIVSLKNLVMSPGNVKLKEIMNPNVIRVAVAEDQEVVARTMNKYDYLALPVVDENCRMKGIVTIDDTVDVIEDEVTEDFHKMSAMAAPGDDYFNLSILRMVWKRLPWLFILLFTASFAAMVLDAYETEIRTLVALSYFIPILLGAGGNAGTQSATIVIRGLATGEIEVGQIFKILARELTIGLILGLALGLAGFFQAQYFLGADPDAVTVCLAVSAALICTIIVATFTGSFLPLVFKRLGLDPAVMAGPFLTTIVDVTGLIIYFEVAQFIIR